MGVSQTQSQTLEDAYRPNSYGGVWRPETQHVNAWGQVWAGDPPHEAPGWYDLYDTDGAMDVVAKQQQDIAAWMKGGH